ncbi:sensor histidine kinase, partial [Streptomyces seoulensis]
IRKIGAELRARDPELAATGLKGLTERLATAGGSLTAAPAPRGGFTVTAELPRDPEELTAAALAAPVTAAPAAGEG